MSKKFYPVLIAILLMFLFACGCGDDGSVNIVNQATPTPGTNLSTVNGIVYGTEGTPVSGAAVTLTPNLTGSETYGEVQTATTGTDGRFSFTVSFSGTYFVQAKEGTLLIGSQEFTLSLGSTITLVLGQASTGTLRVQLTPSDAVASVTVTGITSSSFEITSAQSAAGEYIFYIPGGTYSFIVNAEGYNSVTRSVTVNAGEETVETVDLTGEEIDIGTLTKIEPRVIVNQNLTTQEIKVRGSNFTGNGTDNNITITLVSSGGVNIPVSGITVDDPNTVRFTADFTGASSEEYILTLTHSPITTSSSTGSSNIWLTDTIQGAIDKAGAIYSSEAGKIAASASEPGWIEAYIPAGTYNPTPLNSEITLGLSSGVYLKGAGGDAATGTHIVAAANTRHFYAYNNFDIALDSLRLTGGNVSYGGVFYGEYIKGNCLITSSVINGNNSTSSGGALYLIGENNNEVDITINNNTFTQNTCNSDGGAIYIETSGWRNCNLNITGNTISQNRSGTSASTNGGGLYLYYSGKTGGECIITDNTIRDNYCNNNRGGGLYLELDSRNSAEPMHAVIKNNTITGNYITAPAYGGGGIYCDAMSASVDISENTISNNGSLDGGGLYAWAEEGSTINISDNNITGNTGDSSGAGGGLYIDCNDQDSSVTAIGNEISGNGASDTIGSESYLGVNDGGGVYVHYGTKVYINGNNIYSNTGSFGQGTQLYYFDSSPAVDATNNWWGSGVSPEADSIVFNYSGRTVTVSPYASGQFTVPVTP